MADSLLCRIGAAHGLHSVYHGAVKRVPVDTAQWAAMVDRDWVIPAVCCPSRSRQAYEMGC